MYKKRKHKHTQYGANGIARIGIEYKKIKIKT